MFTSFLWTPRCIKSFILTAIRYQLFGILLPLYQFPNIFPPFVGFPRGFDSRRFDLTGPVFAPFGGNFAFAFILPSLLEKILWVFVDHEFAYVSGRWFVVVVKGDCDCLDYARAIL